MKGEVSLIQVSIRELEGLPFKKANDSWGKDWSASSSSHLSFISAKNQLLGRAGSNPGLGVCPYQLAWGLPETQDSEVTFPKPSYLQKRLQLLLPGNKKSIHLLGQDDEVAMPSVCQFRWLWSQLEGTMHSVTVQDEYIPRTCWVPHTMVLVSWMVKGAKLKGWFHIRQKNCSVAWAIC